MKQEQKRLIRLMTEESLKDKMEQVLDEICTNEFIESIKDKFEEKTNEEVEFEFVKNEVGNVVVPFIFENLIGSLSRYCGERNKSIDEIGKLINELHMN